MAGTYATIARGVETGCHIDPGPEIQKSGFLDT